MRLTCVGVLNAKDVNNMPRFVDRAEGTRLAKEVAGLSHDGGVSSSNESYETPRWPRHSVTQKNVDKIR